MIFRSASPFLGGYGGFGGYGLGYGLGGIGCERNIFVQKINMNISHHLELTQMLQVHICPPKPSLHPTLWLRLRAVVPGNAWLCLVVPGCNARLSLVVPESTWQHNLVCQIIPASISHCLVAADNTWQQCLVAPDRTCMQCTWHCLAIEIFVP